jgi:hypothetical protein
LGVGFLYAAWECLGYAWAPKFPSRVKFALCSIACWVVVVGVGRPFFTWLLERGMLKRSWLLPAEKNQGEKNGEIVLRKCPSFHDVAGTGAGEATVEELKKELDEMREEDNDD